MVDQLERILSDLPDDLAEIARSIPIAPKGLGILRQTMALLPPPLGATTQPSFPADELTPPEQAVDTMAGDGPGTVSGAVIMPGTIGTPQIAAGAITVAAFASTIRPVVLVHGLPALPDASYPVDSFVYDIDAVPKRLYKNVANVWVAAIGPDDIQANSITAGQIAAGAIATSELAVTLVLPGSLANEAGVSPGVFMDSTGLLIRNGKLTLQDEFGSSTLIASGFSGSWRDFIAFGIYNGGFKAGVVGTVPNGRTAALPYWTASDLNVGGTLAFLAAGAGIKFTWGAIGDKKKIVSDVIKNTSGEDLEIGVHFDATRAAGTLNLVVEVENNTKEDFTGFSTGGSADSVSVAIVFDDGGDLAVVTTPGGGPFFRLVITAEETGSHSASNQITLTSAWLRSRPQRLGSVDVSTYLSAGALVVYADNAVDPPVEVNGNLSVDGFIYADSWIGDRANLDVRMRRSAAKAIVFDDNGGDPLTTITMDAIALNITRTDGSGAISINLESGGSSNSANISVGRGGDTTLRSLFSSEGIQFGPGNAARDLRLFRTSASKLGLDDGTTTKAIFDAATGMFSEYGDNAWTSYNPTVANLGTGTNSTAIGYYQKLGKIVFIRIYLICNANGTGSGIISVTTPSSPDRTSRQFLPGVSEGHTAPFNGAVQLVALVGGSGAVWDRIRAPAAATGMIGTDYDNGGIIIFQGWYAEA